MDTDFTVDKVRMVSQAICKYLKSSANDTFVIVGYDTRRNSKLFALHVSAVLRSNRIDSLVTNRPTPTPVTAFQVMHKKAGAGIMITASHNPPIYNGIKFIPHYAGPATVEITSQIEEQIASTSRSELKPVSRQSLEGRTKFFEPSDEYIRYLRSIIDMETITKASLKVAYDPMHGAASGYVDSLLREARCQVKLINSTQDPDFGGVNPEPMKETLVDLCRVVAENSLDFGLANDGDGDRLAACDQNGTYLDANMIYPVLYLHLISIGKIGDAVRTVSTTHMIDRIAEDHGFNVLEVPVGFKHIGETLRARKAVVGGEESGGFSTSFHISEKDGIFAAMLLTQAVAHSGKALSELLEEIHEKYGRLYSSRIDLSYAVEKKQQVLAKLHAYEPKTVCGLRVSERRTVDGVKLILENASWLLIRPSGTEPLIRIYCESPESKMIPDLLGEGRRLVSS